MQVSEKTQPLSEIALMLQELIKDLQSTLSNYNQGLAKQNLLVDNPWTMLDGDLNVKRLIFKRNNSLYIVKEGEIEESTWEYLPAMNSQFYHNWVLGLRNNINTS